jgi:hypothetical protein
MKLLSLILFLLPFTCLAQLTIKGKVINASDGQPVPDASVFLNNATIGTKSDNDGTFTLRNLSQGQYDLIVSVIGFETFRQVIVVNNSLVISDVKILPKTTVMNEVVIGGKDPNRARKLRMFKEQFLGSSAIARKCTILNPEVLTLKFSNHKQVLTASTEYFLEIENNALGYKLKYLLNKFVLDRKASNMSYEGFVLFEEKDGTPEERSNWNKNRLGVYYGSPTHFLRTILAGKVDSDYMVRPFCIKLFDTVKSINFGNNDTITYNMIRYDTLRVADYVHRTDKRGVYAINYPGDLDIFYYPPGVKHLLDTDGREYGNRGQVGSIDFIDESLFFDINGTILNPTGAFFRYRWGLSRVAELLPIDYWPPIREAKGRKLYD